MYTLVDSTLSPDNQLVQTTHAAIGYVATYPEETRQHIKDSNYLVCLAAKDSEHLEEILNKAKEKGIKTYSYTEPDYNNRVTAIVLEPGKIAQRLCSSIPLALRAGSSEKEQVNV